MDTPSTSPRAPDLLFAAAVRRALGISQRQLDHFLWTHPELEPPKLGGRRVFSREDVARLRTAFDERPRRGHKRAAS